MKTYGPDAIRNGFRMLITPWNAGDPTSIFAIAVDPGNASVAKGGDQLITAEEVAEWSDTISYEVLTSIGPRVERRHVE